MIHHVTRATRHLIFWGLMSLALALTAIRITLYLIDGYKADIETAISQEISAPVTIGQLTAGMRGFRPELVLKNVSVQRLDKPQQSALKIAEVHLSISLLRSFSQQQIIASSWITLVGAQLTLVHQRNGQISILGLTSAPGQAPPFWLLQTAQVQILQSRVGWQEEKNRTQLHFDDIDISLKNTRDGRQHWLNLVSALPGQYGEMLRLSMHLEGNFLAPQGLNGLIYADLKNAQLANPYTTSAKKKGGVKMTGSDLGKLLPWDIAISKGNGDLTLWSHWRNSQLQDLTGVMQLRQTQLQRSGRSPLLISRLSNRFQLIQQLPAHWELTVDQLTLKSHAVQLTGARIFAQGNTDPDNSADAPKTLQQLQLQAQNIDLSQITALSAFFNAPGPAASVLKTLRGQLNNFWLRIQPETGQFALSSDFEQLSIEANATLPGIRRLSGHLQGDQRAGSIALDARNLVLELPGVFAAPLTLETLKARFDWRQTLDGWLFESPLATLTVPDIKVNSRLKLALDRETFDVNIDLTSAFSGANDIHTFAKYFPVGLMGKDAVDWLNRAFIKGQIKPRGALLKGNLADFPFRNQEGVFQIALDIIDTDLAYMPDWAPLQTLNAEILFYQEGMQVVAQDAFANEFKFSELAMQIKSFDFSEYLTIDGAGDGDLYQILDYLQQSPLKPRLAEILRLINPKGPTGLTLALQIPLVDRVPLKVNGEAELRNVNFEVLPIKLPITQTHGTLEFNEQGLTQGAFEAESLDNPLSSKLKQGSDKLQIEVLGHLHVNDLQQHLKQSLWRYVQGETDFFLTLNLPDADDQYAQLHVNSQLTGLTVTLPDALAKSAESAQPFDLHIVFKEQSGIPLTVKYAEQLQAALNIDFTQKQIRSGQILLGEGQLGAMPAAGMRLDINVNRFSAADWLTLADDDTENSSAKPLFDKITLRTEHLLWQQQDAGLLQLTMRHKAQAWRIEIDSPLLKGEINKPLDASGSLPTLLNLDYINLSDLSKLKSSDSEKKLPKRLPLFTINSKRVLWDKLDLGALAIETRLIDNGLEFTKFALKNSRGLLEMNGNWLLNAAEERTNANGKLTMRNFGDFIKQLDFTGDLKETEALITFALNWKGPPQSFGLAKLDGQIDVQLTNGRILSIEPGFGRILGFLAMEQWGRRLRLNFDDMIAQGLTFNSIAGRFNLNQGNAVTDHLKIDAVPAIISISGSSYLPGHSLNHHITVLPKSSAAVPIAGTIVDKVLTFAVETLTGTSQEGFLLGSEYQIRGTWQDPEVTQLHDNDGLLPKTWSGLTDFSWFSKTP